jgi:hypothetical protein
VGWLGYGFYIMEKSILAKFQLRVAWLIYYEKSLHHIGQQVIEVTYSQREEEVFVMNTPLP